MSILKIPNSLVLTFEYCICRRLDWQQQEWRPLCQDCQLASFIIRIKRLVVNENNDNYGTIMYLNENLLIKESLLTHL